MTTRAMHFYDAFHAYPDKQQWASGLSLAGYRTEQVGGTVLDPGKIFYAFEDGSVLGVAFHKNVPVSRHVAWNRRGAGDDPTAYHTPIGTVHFDLPEVADFNDRWIAEQYEDDDLFSRGHTLYYHVTRRDLAAFGEWDSWLSDVIAGRATGAAPPFPAGVVEVENPVMMGEYLPLARLEDGSPDPFLFAEPLPETWDIERREVLLTETERETYQEQVPESYPCSGCEMRRRCALAWLPENVDRGCLLAHATTRRTAT